MSTSSENIIEAGPASVLLAEWKVAIVERDKIVSDRINNMGIEEHLDVLAKDVSMNAYFLNRLIEVVAEIESK
jgi:hypothetical protein